MQHIVGGGCEARIPWTGHCVACVALKPQQQVVVAHQHSYAQPMVSLPRHTLRRPASASRSHATCCRFKRRWCPIAHRSAEYRAMTAVLLIVTPCNVRVGVVVGLRSAASVYTASLAGASRHDMPRATTSRAKRRVCQLASVHSKSSWPLYNPASPQQQSHQPLAFQQSLLECVCSGAAAVAAARASLRARMRPSCGGVCVSFVQDGDCAEFLQLCRTAIALSSCKAGVCLCVRLEA